jgi:hypothetical protein
MTTLNTNGTPRKKYTTKKMIMKKNRKNGQKKAWDTRKALYPETNGYKPKQVEFEATKMPMSAPIKKVKDSEVDVPKESESVPSKSDPKEVDNKMTTKLTGGLNFLERIDNLDDFLNSIPGVEFNRDEFVSVALETAVDTIFSGVAVVVTGEEKLIKRLKGMMEFMEEEV